MAKHRHEDHQYAPFGDGWIRRTYDEPGAVGEWVGVDPDDVPLDVIVSERIVQRDQSDPNPRRRLGMKRHPNETPDKIAAELGLTPIQLRVRLNDTNSDGTLIRVPDKEFDRMARDLGLGPKEMRDRFAGRNAEALGLVSPSRILAE